MCYTVSGKAKIVPADTRLEKPCKARKKPLSRHNFWLCFEVNRNRSTGVDLLRPHENNPNILLLGESFGLFVYLSIPTLIARNENSRYHGLLTLVSALALLKNTQIYDIIKIISNQNPFSVT